MLSLLASEGSRKSDDQTRQERFAHGPDATSAARSRGSVLGVLEVGGAAPELVQEPRHGAGAAKPSQRLIKQPSNIR